MKVALNSSHREHLVSDIRAAGQMLSIVETAGSVLKEDGTLSYGRGGNVVTCGSSWIEINCSGPNGPEQLRFEGLPASEADPRKTARERAALLLDLLEGAKRWKVDTDQVELPSAKAELDMVARVLSVAAAISDVPRIDTGIARLPSATSPACYGLEDDWEAWMLPAATAARLTGMLDALSGAVDALQATTSNNRTSIILVPAQFDLDIVRDPIQAMRFAGDLPFSHEEMILERRP